MYFKGLKYVECLLEKYIGDINNLDFTIYYLYIRLSNYIINVYPVIHIQ